AGIDGGPATKAWSQWREQRKALEAAIERQASLQQESERLAWQIAEIEKLDPGTDEWPELNAQHSRLANAQALMDAAASASSALDDGDDNAASLLHRALAALQAQANIEPAFNDTIETLQTALAQV